MNKRVKLSRLVREVNALAMKADNDSTLQMLYDGEVIAEYECWGMYEPDAKTPEEWVRGNSVFLIDLQGRDINKVTLAMK